MGKYAAAWKIKDPTIFVVQPELISDHLNQRCPVVLFFVYVPHLTEAVAVQAVLNAGPPEIDIEVKPVVSTCDVLTEMRLSRSG